MLFLNTITCVRYVEFSGESVLTAILNNTLFSNYVMHRLYNIPETPGHCGALIRASGYTRAVIVPLGTRSRGRAVLREMVQGRPGVFPPCAARPRVAQEVPAAWSRRRGEVKHIPITVIDNCDIMEVL